jgi:cathepsin F
MRHLLLLVVVVVVLGASPRMYDLQDEPRSLWNQYMTDYRLSFGDEEVAEARFQTFQDNLGVIRELNLRSNHATFGITKFTHLSQDEFKKQYLTLRTTDRSEGPVAELYSQNVIDALPDTFDWRDKKAVTDVKDQGQCGSCWAFSATGNMEGQWFLAGHTLTSLSEQNLVDCDHECLDPNDCDAGCEGGLQPNAYNYVIKNGGIDTEDSYPYTAEDDTCAFKANSVGAKISNWTFISKDEDQAQAYLVEHGPLAVAVDATIWQFYFGGVITVGCGTSLDHGVLIVGYGNETDIWGQQITYWTIKNSWGADWGYSGYVYIEKGSGCCGVDQYITSSIV